MLAFAQFGSDLDQSTKSILEHGAKVFEFLKQSQYQPIDDIHKLLFYLATKKELLNPLP